MEPASTAATDVSRDLADLLFALEPGPASTRVVTRHLTDVVVRWALANGWTPRVEARVEAIAALVGTPQLGYIDIVVTRNDGAPDLAIEIDSGDKPWSVDKLRHAARAGMHAVWVRWGDQQWAGVYDDVDVIQLWLPRRPARHAVSDQLPIW
jgi:hypothetical protein